MPAQATPLSPAQLTVFDCVQDHTNYDVALLLLSEPSSMPTMMLVGPACKACLGSDQPGSIACHAARQCTNHTMQKTLVTIFVTSAHTQTSRPYQCQLARLRLWSGGAPTGRGVMMRSFWSRFNW